MSYHKSNHAKKRERTAVIIVLELESNKKSGGMTMGSNRNKSVASKGPFVTPQSQLLATDLTHFEITQLCWTCATPHVLSPWIPKLGSIKHVWVTNMIIVGFDCSRKPNWQTREGLQTALYTYMANQNMWACGRSAEANQVILSNHEKLHQIQHRGCNYSGYSIANECSSRIQGCNRTTVCGSLGLLLVRKTKARDSSSLIQSTFSETSTASTHAAL